MSYYSVNRDDNELRIVICPACTSKNADVKDLDLYIPYKCNNSLLKLMQCNKCKTYFSFYREDGLREIPKSEALEGIKKSRHIDLQRDGRDEHGHCFYIVFKEKPPTISYDRYSKLKGYEENIEADEKFKKWIDRIPSINEIIEYEKFIENIDFEKINKNIDKKIINTWFK